jgi:tRNA-specific 2-thiouridylase
MRLVAAMSGGVDSSVAAARMVDAGHEVVGVHLALARNRAAHRSGSRGCCTIEDAHDARRVADALGIAFYVWDLSETFAREVVDDFIDEYAAGRTPNPCVRCNESVKIAAVAERALALGYDGIVTGHYAQVLPGPSGPELHRGVDAVKDQSYVLGVIGRRLLDVTHLPLGASTKDAIRAEARERGLLVARKPDSYDVCFIKDGDTQAFLRDRLGPRPGPIVDQDGAVLGTHDGAYAYTVGQRRGLGLTVPAADGRPRFVLAVEPATSTVIVGPAEALEIAALTVSPPTWLTAPHEPVPELLEVQVRAHEAPVPASWDATDPRGVGLSLRTPLRGVAPGQEAVLYQGSRVLGSARIVAAG